MGSTTLRATMLAAIATLLGGTASRAAEAFHWGNVAIGGGGFVSGIIPSLIEQNVFYARTDVGGAYRWDETTKKWVALTDWMNRDELGLMGIEALAVDPKTPGKVYMVAGTVYWNQASDGIGKTAFLRSSDYGQTWEKIYTWDDATKWFHANGNGMGRGNGERLAIDPNDPNVVYYGSRANGLFKSTDNGSTWKHVDAWTKAAGSDTTWNGCGFSFVSFAPGSSTNLYAGMLREGDNVYRSTDGGANWAVIPDRPKPSTQNGYVPRLMPQRIAITPDSGSLYITFGDGAGPHTMAWDEGWGMIQDWFNRGAVLKYSPTSGTWSDVSPANFVDPRKDGNNDNDYDTAGAYAATFSGIACNPSNPLEMVATDIGYRAAQFWYLGGDDLSLWNKKSSWTQSTWGSNIYYSNDGGKKWYKSFRYFWMDGGIYPYERQMNANGIGWLEASTIHWSGSSILDPFNSKRAFVTSGNGVFLTDDITAFSVDSSQYPPLVQKTIWKVASQGIEEVVPEEVVSIPGGPLVSVIADYDGFRHDDATQYPSTRHKTSVSGTSLSLGSTRALAFAPKSGKLVKVSDVLKIKVDDYSTVPISPLQYSKDSGSTWSVATYESLDTAYTGGSSVALSTDGAVTLWTPLKKSGSSGRWPVKRYANSAWSTVSGIDGAWVLGDPLDASIFYAYKNSDGTFYKSTDKGVTFAKVGTPGASDNRKVRTFPGKTGDLWLPISKDGVGSLQRSQDGGATWATVGGFSACEAVSFGKGPDSTSSTSYSVVAFGVLDGTKGVYLSDDLGVTWTRVNDDAHEYGGLANGEFVVGDMNTHGVVYMSTAGRGIAARLPGASDQSSTGVRRSTSNVLAKVAVRKDGSRLLFTGLPVGASIEVLDLRGRHLLQQTSTGSSLRLQLPSSSLNVIRLKASGQSRTFLH